jgi:hypothetical protein
MKTQFAAIALAALFLSAGAFAGNDSVTIRTAVADAGNVTVIEKNSPAPVKTDAVIHTCGVNRCVDI